MKKLFLSLIVLCSATSTWAQFYHDDLFYMITSHVEPYTVEAVRQQTYYELKTVNIPDTVTHAGITYNVTSVGNECFSECHELSSVTLGNNIKIIKNEAFYNCHSLSSIILGDNVETIEDAAFYMCGELRSIKLGNNVKSIGSGTFAGCRSLSSINIPNSVAHIGQNAFGETSLYNNPENWENNLLYIENCLVSADQYAYGAIEIREGTRIIADRVCEGLQYIASITIPNTVTSIGEDAFAGCSSLTDVVWNVKNCQATPFRESSSITSFTFGDSVEIIPDFLCYEMPNLKTVNVGNNVKSIGGSAFTGCSSLTIANIPNGITSIGEYAFGGCSSLTAINIPDSLTSISNGVFGNCSSLTSITIPNTVTSIGEVAFEGCSSLKSITIGTNVTDIGRFAFAECPSLDSIVWNAKKLQDDSHVGDKIFNSLSVPLSVTSITFGDSVEHIPSGMCAGMPNLTSVSMGKNVKIIGPGAFFDCTFLESIPISESVEIIGGQAFQGCHRLKSITLPESLKIIGGSAFHVCTSLTSVVIPDSVTTIEGDAFASCSALESLTIGKSVNYIGLLVVIGCSSLKLIDCKATTPPNFDSMINMKVNFMSCPSDLVVYVPCGATNAYKNHQHWSYFGNQIKEASYTIDVYSQDSNKGHVVVDQNSICDGAQITAIPHEGYSFIQWTDGNTDNPRRFEITRDTTFTAVFDQIFKGQCGDSLYWHYALNTLTITGTGAMWDNRPWGSVVNEIEHVSLPTGLTYIGDDAFQDCLGLHNIDIPGTVNSIGDYSFNGCRNLTAINCYPLLPPYAETTSFSNYSAQLNAPCDSLEAYKYDMVFGQFRNFECIGSESTTTDGVSIEPTSNTATVTWPTEEGAETYTIEIMNGDEVFCLLTFNADGMLLNIAFAPSRNGNHHPAQYAEQTTNGLRFTITNLHEGTRYGYDITAKDEEDQTLSTYSGEFTTESLTAVENIILPDNNTHKILHNGQLLILRDGKTYNAMGQEM